MFTSKEAKSLDSIQFYPAPQTMYLSTVLFSPCPRYMALNTLFSKNTFKCLLGVFYMLSTDHIYVNSFNPINNPEKGESYNPKYTDKETDD